MAPVVGRFKKGDRVVFAGSLVTPYIVVIVDCLACGKRIGYVHRRPETNTPENQWNSYDEKMYMTPSEWRKARTDELMREILKTIDTCDSLQEDLARLNQEEVVVQLKEEIRRTKNRVVNVDGDVVEKGSIQDDRTWGLNHA